MLYVGANENSPGTGPEGESLAGRYLLLTLGSESCAVPVHKVRDIIRLPIFPGIVPTGKPVTGVIELRGKRIPVMDLRSRFGQRPQQGRDRSCVVILQLSSPPTEARMVGLVVDAVDEVVDIDPSQIMNLAEVGSRVDSAFVMGAAKVQGLVKTLLDVDRVAALEALRRRLGGKVALVFC